MPGAADPLDDLLAPVDYALPWGWVAAGLVLLVAAWFAGVAWWGRPGAGAPRDRARRDLARARRRALADLDRVAADVDAGRLDLRGAHQRTSAVVRGFVEDAGGHPARSMALADLRAAGATDVAAVVALLYPPEFAADADRVSRERLDDSLHRAREVVAAWR